jgi:hypothetical protein
MMKAKASAGKVPARKPLSKAEQSAAFIEAAQALGCDDDPERFKETVGKLAKAPPAPGAKKATRR